MRREKTISSKAEHGTQVMNKLYSLSGPDGPNRPELLGLYEAMCAAEPDEDGAVTLHVWVPGSFDFSPMDLIDAIEEMAGLLVGELCCERILLAAEVMLEEIRGYTENAGIWECIESRVFSAAEVRAVLDDSPEQQALPLVYTLERLKASGDELAETLAEIWVRWPKRWRRLG